MSERFEQLTRRHQQLRLRSADQRRELAQIAGDIEQRLHRVDRGVQAVRGFVSRPLMIAGLFAALAMIGPRRLLGFASRGAVLLTAARKAARRLQ